MAQKNVTVVYHIETGQPRMVVVDAVNLADPAWHPEGHAHIPVHPDVYNKMTHDDLHAHVRNMVANAMLSVTLKE